MGCFESVDLAEPPVMVLRAKICSALYAFGTVVDSMTVATDRSVVT